MMLKYLIETSIFRYSKNYGSLTHETRIKDAVNIGDLICLLATVRTLKWLKDQILPAGSLLRTHVLNLSLNTNSKNSSPIEYLVLIKGISPIFGQIKLNIGKYYLFIIFYTSCVQKTSVNSLCKYNYHIFFYSIHFISYSIKYHFFVQASVYTFIQYMT